MTTEENPDDPFKSRRKELLALAEKDPKRALRLLIELRQEAPDDVKLLGYICTVQITLKDYRGALATAEDIIQRVPNDEHAIGLKAEAQLGLRDYRGALATAEERIRRDPECKHGFWLKGQAQLGLKDYAGALATAEDIIQRDPKYRYSYGMKARALFALNRVEEAKQCLLGLLEIKPNNPTACWLLAEQFLAENNPAEAAHYLREGLKGRFNIRFFRALYDLAEMGVGREMYEAMFAFAFENKLITDKQASALTLSPQVTAMADMSEEDCIKLADRWAAADRDASFKLGAYTDLSPIDRTTGRVVGGGTRQTR